MTTLSILTFESARALIPFIDANIFEEISDKISQQIDSIITINSHRNLHNIKDSLYLDQRVQFMILPWRRFVVGANLDVGAPFLSTDILGVVRNLSEDDRKDKSLYRSVVQELVPEVFQIQRALFGQEKPNWLMELVHRKNDVIRSLDTPSRLDDYVDKSAIEKLLASPPPPKQGPTWKQFIRARLGATALRLFDARTRPRKPVGISTEVLLLRLLTMREVLSR